MKFFILGDSYGVGEYYFKNRIARSIPDTGLDYYLTQLGHSCTNVSVGASCNFGQIRNAYWHLKENSEYDYIIWFHTEPVRDIVEHIIDDPVDGPKQYPKFKNIKDFNRALQYVNDCNYKFAQEKIYKEFNIPWVVIGGLGRLEDSINNYTFAHHKIYSWVEELLNLNFSLPRNLLVTWHRSFEVFDHFEYDKQQVLDELRNVEKYENLLKESPLFPDNSHVIRTEYKKLADRILKML